MTRLLDRAVCAEHRELEVATPDPTVEIIKTEQVERTRALEQILS